MCNMATLFHELLLNSAERCPDRIALRSKGNELSYAGLAGLTSRVANGLRTLGLQRLDRVGVYLPKRVETVAAFFGIAAAQGVFVPINPLLKADQVGYIIDNCDVRILITSRDRWNELKGGLRQETSVRHVVLVDSTDFSEDEIGWDALLALPEGRDFAGRSVIDIDMAAILYTSGSTGKPKGVVLSHRNLITGAVSVSTYLDNHQDDRLLAVLPFSFDYGLSQVTTAFRVGASVTLMDYLFPRDVVRGVETDRITGLAAVPPVWIQLADLTWPAGITEHLRYITNSGGRMPRPTLDKLRASLPGTKPFLMYGLTEAFRGTYLPPDQIDSRPDSMGKAIPNAEILVVRPDGTPCAPNEPGELVQRGSLVALGYWNDPQKTAERFKPLPGQRSELPITELAVWSGDTVRMDDEGFLFFVGRHDEMIKTSGYRVSPTEVEEIIYASGHVADAVAFGAPHPKLGEAIVVVASPHPSANHEPVKPADSADTLMVYCKQKMPNYMVPQHFAWLDALPRNPNGKFDRPALAAQFKNIFGAD
jgi:acyl-CoA ligase (AMP-forming) (exosortase A-associated)